MDVPRKDGDEERQKCMKCKKIQTGFRQSKYKIHKLHEENYAKPDTLGRMRTNAARLFECIEQNPVIETQKTVDSLGLSYNTAATVIKNHREVKPSLIQLIWIFSKRERNKEAVQPCHEGGAVPCRVYEKNFFIFAISLFQKDGFGCSGCVGCGSMIVVFPSGVCCFARCASSILAFRMTVKGSLPFIILL